jgi:hypothetical protein
MTIQAGIEGGEFWRREVDNVSAETQLELDEDLFTGEHQSHSGAFAAERR